MPRGAEVSLPALGAFLLVQCPSCSTLDEGEVVEVREDEHEAFVRCPGCAYVMRVEGL